MNGIGDAIVGAMVVLCIVVAIVVGSIVYGVGYYMEEDELRVKQPLKPQIEIHTIDGKSDTTYIYKFE
ncbi:MAG: hypothetical protein RLZZ196_978 [Bacteroidota bacterium]|jgi:hypothetical protein